MEPFLLRSRKRQECPVSSLLFNIGLEVPARVIREERGGEGEGGGRHGGGGGGGTKRKRKASITERNK